MTFDSKVIDRWVDALRGSVESWELEALDDQAYVEDAFSRDLSFGTGGMRGLMGVGPNRLNALTVGRVTQGLADWLDSSVGGRPPQVAIAYDTRIHSRDFAELTARVLAANGVRVSLFRWPVPTPVLSFAVRELACDAGVVVTASHNPKEYNGYKVYGSTGDQATDSLAHAVQGRVASLDVFSDVRSVPLEEALSAGAVEYVDEGLLDSYIDAVLAQRVGVDCSGLHISYSPLNGTGLVLVERLAERLGVVLDVVSEQAAPDGTFPTCPRPNPELPVAMELGERRMLAEGTDLLAANDPDADRLGVAVPDGLGGARLLTGDEVGLLLLDFLARVAPRPATGTPVAVTTVVSSPLADDIAEANGVELRRTLTGFKYVGEQVDLLEREGESDRFLLGFEESCGYLRGSYVRDKDGIDALMLVCELAAWHKARGCELPQALDELYARYGYVVGRQISLELPGQAGRAVISRAMSNLRQTRPEQVGGLAVEAVTDYSQGSPMPVVGSGSTQVLPPSDVLQWDLEGGSRVLVRPSGTEPKIKCYCFALAADEATADVRLEELMADMQVWMGSGGEGDRPIHVVLLSGGSGTRLWPLSNRSRSKQFLKVLRDDACNHVSMVQRVFSQIARVPANLDVTIATSAAQAEELALQVPRERYALVAEPERRDTAPAIMLACEHLALEQGASEDDVVVVMPIDSFADQAYYDRIPKVARAVEEGNSELVLVGVKPTYPSEKYGYVIPSSVEGDVWPVCEFREKPNEATAERYIEEGGLWNCGVFGFRLGWLRAIVRRYLDAPSFGDYLRRYRELPRNSFDYEVVERARSVSVVPYIGAWKDLGTWNTLTEEMAEPYAGDVHADGATVRNVHAINETSLPMVVAGISDAVVVATPDGILVSGKEASTHIKGLVSEAELGRPMQEKRAWGSWEALSGAGVRLLSVRAGEGVAVRSRGWDRRLVVVSGTGTAAIDGAVRGVRAGSVVVLPANGPCEVRALADLELVEVRIQDADQGEQS